MDNPEKDVLFSMRDVAGPELDRAKKFNRKKQGLAAFAVVSGAVLTSLLLCSSNESDLKYSLGFATGIAGAGAAIRAVQERRSRNIYEGYVDGMERRKMTVLGNLSRGEHVGYSFAVVEKAMNEGIIGNEEFEVAQIRYFHNLSQAGDGGRFSRSAGISSWGDEGGSSAVMTKTRPLFTVLDWRDQESLAHSPRENISSRN
jgi:hypothetical protein